MADLKVITGNFAAAAVPNPGLANDLRALADRVEKGEVKSVIAAYIGDGDYCFLKSCSLEDALMLMTLGQRRAVDDMLVR
jgi:hypothetical protein